MNWARKIISISKRDNEATVKEYIAVADDGTVWRITDTGILAPRFNDWEQVLLPQLPEAGAYVTTKIS